MASGAGKGCRTVEKDELGPKRLEAMAGIFVFVPFLKDHSGSCVETKAVAIIQARDGDSLARTITGSWKQWSEEAQDLVIKLDEVGLHP